MSKMTSSASNIYQLDGRVPIMKAIPVGLQLIVMFVTNLTPVAIIAAAGGLSQEETSVLLQNAMLIAGLATLVQLYPIWKIGSRLPLVMGISFKFVPVLYTIAEVYGYPTALGAALVGGIFEGVLGLFAKYWRKIVSPIVSASVVTVVGLSLFAESARSFGGGHEADFGSAQNWIVGAVTLVVCLAWFCFAKGYLKHLFVLAGLVVGYIIALCMGKVDLSVVFSDGFIALPKFLPYVPEFHIEAIIPVCIIYLVSAAETIGDTTAMAVVGLHRDVQDKEVSGALACGGFFSSVSALMGCSPVTSLSENTGLITMTGVFNRFTIMTGAVCMILAGFFPPLGNFFTSIPEPVLGGCTVVLFGIIFALGLTMLVKAGLNQRNILIMALSMAIGVGFTSMDLMGLWSIFPEIVCSVFSADPVPLVFVTAIILNLVLPKNMEQEKIEE